MVRDRTHIAETRGYTVYITESSTYEGPMGFRFEIYGGKEELYSSRYYPYPTQDVLSIIAARIDEIEAARNMSTSDWDLTCLAFEAGSPCDLRLMNEYKATQNPGE